MDPGSQTRYCPTCGTPFEPNFRFCKQCGTPLPGGRGGAGGGRRVWLIGIVCVVAAAGAAALVQRAISTSATSGVQVCDVRKLKLRVWLRAGPDGVSDGYTLGSSVPCRLKKPLILYVSLKAADGTVLPTSFAGLKDQETISGAVGIRLAPGLPPISDSSTSFSPLGDWCRVPYPQPWTLGITSVPGPTETATAVICQGTATPAVDRRAVPAPGASSKALATGPLCVRSPSRGARLATAVGVAKALRSGQLTAGAGPRDVGQLYRRLVGADAAGYVTWVPDANPHGGRPVCGRGLPEPGGRRSRVAIARRCSAGGRPPLSVGGCATDRGGCRKARESDLRSTARGRRSDRERLLLHDV
jgi:hypothetical protein